MDSYPVTATRQFPPNGRKVSGGKTYTFIDKRSVRSPSLAEYAPLLRVLTHLVLGDPIPVEELELEADVLDAVRAAPLDLAALVDPLEVLRQVKDERLVEDRVQRLLLHVRLLLRARALLVAQHVDLDVRI